MQPFSPALDDLLELLEALDRHLRPLRAGEGVIPAGDPLLLKPLLDDLHSQAETLIADIQSIDAGFRRCRNRLAHLPAGYICTGSDGVILEANRAAAALLGLAPACLQGVPLPEHLHPGCIPAFQSAVAALTRGEEVPVQEFSLARHDGSTFPAAVAVSVSRDPGGGIAECLWAIYDISGQKKVEEALRESEERYRELTGNISDAFLALDRDNRIIFWNVAAARLSGSPEEEVLGKSIYDVFPNLRDEAVIGFFREVLEAGRAGVSECRFRLQERDHTVEVRAIPTRDGISVYLQDISDRRRAEEALRKSEEQCRTVVESQTELIYRWLPDGTITFVNDAYCRYIGIPCGDLIGRRYTPAVPADDLARIQRSLRSLTPEHPVSTVEHRVVMPDGRVRWQQWTNTVFFNREGSVAKYQSVGRDITDARMAEEALLLANRKLNLLSDVTRHDILNRLNVLSGYLDLSRERTGDPELLQYYQKEEEAVRDIRRYMAFTGEYRDVGMASPLWQNVSQIAHEAMVGLDTGEVTVEVQAGDIEVYADPLIVRVFTNLIDNSLQHGGGITRIRIYPEESDRGISIVYEDDGIGVPDAEKEKIFKRGFGQQTGFGLFLAREILSITDLSLRETGEPGKGVRFEIRVPPGFYRFIGRGRVP